MTCSFRVDSRASAGGRAKRAPAWEAQQATGCRPGASPGVEGGGRRAAAGASVRPSSPHPLGAPADSLLQATPGCCVLYLPTNSAPALPSLASDMPPGLPPNPQYPRDVLRGGSVAGDSSALVLIFLDAELCVLRGGAQRLLTFRKSTDVFVSSDLSHAHSQAAKRGARAARCVWKQ